MGPRIRADRAAAETGKKRARAKAEKAFKTKVEAAPAAHADGPRDLKQTVMDLGLAAKRDYAHFLKGLKALNEKKDQVVGLIRNHKKRAKESNIDPAHLDAAIKWEKADPMEFKRWLAGLMRACEVNGMDVPELGFADESGLSAAEKAFQDGHRAGLGGKGYTDNPHEMGSDGNREWEAGRMRGQAELLGVDATAQSTLPGAEMLEDGEATPNEVRAARNAPPLEPGAAWEEQPEGHYGPDPLKIPDFMRREAVAAA